MKRIHFSMPWPLSAGETREIIHFAFQAFFTLYLFCFLTESLHPGFVSRHFSLHAILLLVIIFGVVTSMWSHIAEEGDNDKSISTYGYLWMVILSILTIVVVWQKISSLAAWSFPIAILGGIVVFFLLLFIDQE